MADRCISATPGTGSRYCKPSVEVYVDPIVIAFLFCHGSFVMKNKDRLKRRTAVCHDIKDNSGLPLVPATAFGFASHRFCPLEVIGIAAKKFKWQWCFV
jgi:hypothetical protein